jgi:hypothetical protein
MISCAIDELGRKLKPYAEVEKGFLAALDKVRTKALGLVVMLSLAGVSATAQMPLKRGDILIADSNAAILHFDPRSGKLGVLASGWPLVQPFGITVNAEGHILVTDTGTRAVIRINPKTGTKEIVATVPGLPFGLAVNDSGDIFVANAEAVLRIKGDTGGLSVVAAGGVPLGVALASDGNIFVADAQACVVKVDVNNGARTLISRGQSLFQPVGITLDANGNLLIVDSAAACVIEVNALNGEQKVVSQGENLKTPVCAMMGKSGSILVSDPDCFNLSGGIIRVNPADGSQTSLMQSRGDYLNPRGFFIIGPGQMIHPKF